MANGGRSKNLNTTPTKTKYQSTTNSYSIAINHFFTSSSKNSSKAQTNLKNLRRQSFVIPKNSNRLEDQPGPSSNNSASNSEKNYSNQTNSNQTKTEKLPVSKSNSVKSKSSKNSVKQENLDKLETASTSSSVLIRGISSARINSPESSKNLAFKMPVSQNLVKKESKKEKNWACWG